MKLLTRIQVAVAGIELSPEVRRYIKTLQVDEAFDGEIHITVVYAIEDIHFARTVINAQTQQMIEPLDDVAFLNFINHELLAGLWSEADGGIQNFIDKATVARAAFRHPYPA